jgi:hypothetical protein
MLLRKINIVYYKNYTKHTVWLNIKFVNVKDVGAYLYTRRRIVFGHVSDGPVDCLTEE